jgi:hypothetical protein
MLLEEKKKTKRMATCESEQMFIQDNILKKKLIQSREHKKNKKYKKKNTLLWKGGRV